VAEYDANRIAAAYWREADPSLMANFIASSNRVLASDPNPVPIGEAPESFFNEQYGELGRTPASTWFQSRMILSVNAEHPAPTFAQALVVPEESIYASAP
jgi:hypothetical protein